MTMSTVRRVGRQEDAVLGVACSSKRRMSGDSCTRLINTDSLLVNNELVYRKDSVIHNYTPHHTHYITINNKKNPN